MARGQQAGRFIYILSCDRTIKHLPSRLGLCRDVRFECLKFVLAEKHLSARKKTWRTEITASHRVFCVGDQARLDFRLLDPSEDFISGQTALDQGRVKRVRVIQLFGRAPHMVVNLIEIPFKVIRALGKNSAAHEHQRVHWKVGVLLKAGDTVCF